MENIVSEAIVMIEELVSKAENTIKVRKRRYIIQDFDNEPLRIFNSKADAEWFVKDKPDCSIKVAPYEVEVKTATPKISHAEFTATYGEPPF